MRTYIRPSGSEITINHASEELAVSLGWKLKDAPVPAAEVVVVEAKAKPKLVVRK